MHVCQAPDISHTDWTIPDKQYKEPCGDEGYGKPVGAQTACPVS